MRFGYENIKGESFYFLVTCNDDVALDIYAVTLLLNSIDKTTKSVTVGQCTDTEGKITYGGKTNKNRMFRSSVKTAGYKDDVTTFNMNFTVIPKAVLDRHGFISSRFRHALGDYELGLRYSAQGVPINLGSVIGICEHNSTKGTSADPSLSPLKRAKLLFGVKEHPVMQRFFYLWMTDGFLGILLLPLPYLKPIMTFLKK